MTSAGDSGGLFGSPSTRGVAAAPVAGARDLDDGRDLVVRAQAGDQDAFALLYQDYSPRIYSYFYYHLNGFTHEADDLTNEVFIKVLEKVGTFEFRGLPFTAWLYRVARNHLLDHLRARPKQPSLPLESCYQVREERAERALDNALTAEDLKAGLMELTEDQRQVIVLRFVDGLSTIETALAVDKSEDAVKKLQARGLLMLKKVLSDGRRNGRH